MRNDDDDDDDDADVEGFDHAWQVLWDMSGHPCAARQLPEAPSALRLVPHPASPLGDALLAGANLQVGFCPILLDPEAISPFRCDRYVLRNK